MCFVGVVYSIVVNSKPIFTIMFTVFIILSLVAIAALWIRPAQDADDPTASQVQALQIRLMRETKLFLVAFIASLISLFRYLRREGPLRSQVALSTVRQYLQLLLFGNGILHA